MIPVTKPFLPPQEEYQTYLNGIWHREWLTNMGPLSGELEKKLKNYLGTKHLLYVTNGTIALQMAIKALGLKGEIITTPFSFVATTSSIVWEGCTPVFVDIDRKSLNIDPAKIEEAITPKTTAILATHVYGNPCEVEKIQAIADKYKLKVIYDAAHAFGVSLNGRAIFEYGDISICSLHATKLYHSVEGGLLITKDPETHKRLAYMRNFGFNGPEEFAELGINGKNSEFHAAMGLTNLEYVERIITKRKTLTEHYDQNLEDIRAYRPQWSSGACQNFSYYSLVLESESLLLKIKAELEQNKIFTRRYFYPSLANALPYLESKELPITNDVSKKVLCLPLYYDLTINEVDMVTDIIRSVTQKYFHLEKQKKKESEISIG